MEDLTREQLVALVRFWETAAKHDREQVRYLQDALDQANLARLQSVQLMEEAARQVEEFLK